jgi:hypothetical protein
MSFDIQGESASADVGERALEAPEHLADALTPNFVGRKQGHLRRPDDALSRRFVREQGLGCLETRQALDVGREGREVVAGARGDDEAEEPEREEGTWVRPADEEILEAVLDDPLSTSGQSKSASTQRAGTQTGATHVQHGPGSFEVGLELCHT